MVGNNDAGKSTIIEAVHLALTGLYNGKYLKNELSQYIFNKEIINEYLKKYNSVQLRYNRQIEVNENFRVMNFGDSKGLTFDRVVIYPTKDFCKWLENNEIELKEESRSKFYVALTRARYSIAIIIN